MKKFYVNCECVTSVTIKKISRMKLITKQDLSYCSKYIENIVFFLFLLHITNTFFGKKLIKTFEK